MRVFAKASTRIFLTQDWVFEAKGSTLSNVKNEGISKGASPPFEPSAEPKALYGHAVQVFSLGAIKRVRTS